MKSTDSVGRRSFVRGTLAAIAVGAVTASVAAIAVSALPELIDARRRCQAEYEAAKEQERLAIQAYEATPSPLVPIMLAADGRVREQRELRTFTHDHLVECIEEAHPFDYPSVRHSRAACLHALDVAERADATLQDRLGVEKASDRVTRAAERLHAATLAVLRHPPVTLAEAEMKAEWLTAELSFRNVQWLDFDEMQALVASIGAAPSQVR